MAAREAETGETLDHLEDVADLSTYSHRGSMHELVLFISLTEIVIVHVLRTGVKFWPC